MTLQELKEKVEKRISEYIGFDVDEIFKVGDYITIYGGAVRDSIAEMEIHDVDILCMSDSANKLAQFIQERGYSKVDLYGKDEVNMYQGIKIISEPWTFINNKKSIIQIIRPHYSFRKGVTAYVDSYENLIKNVDISSCGVFIEFNGKENVLKESCKNAIAYCLSKTFIINDWAELYNKDRTSTRENKLLNRGWFNLNPTEYVNSIDLKKAERRLKLSQIEFQPEVTDKYYKIWHEYEYDVRQSYKRDDYEDLPF